MIDLGQGSITVLNIKDYATKTTRKHLPPLPGGTLVLMRPRTLSNPYNVTTYGREGCIALYRYELFQHIQWGGLPDWDVVVDGGDMPPELQVLGQWQMKANTFERFEELATEVARGHDLTLGCVCKPLACHLDVLKKAIAWFNDQRISKGWGPPPVIDADVGPVEETETLPAVTLKRPWPTAILKWGKRIENRTWRPQLKPGDRFLIHAGSSWDKDGARWLESQGYDVGPEEDHLKGIVAIAQFDGVTDKSESPWFMGPLGWQFSEVMRFDLPVDAKGKRNLWEYELPTHYLEGAIPISSSAGLADPAADDSAVHEPPAAPLQPVHASSLTQDAWATVQQMRVGGRYDPRPYGEALRGSYPHIRQWLEGECGEEIERECLIFAMDAINRGSMPMMEVAAIACLSVPSRATKLFTFFSLEDLPRLRSLLRIAAASTDNKLLLQQWMGLLNL